MSMSDSLSAASVSDTPETLTFDQLNLNGPLLEAITAAGYTVPTPIQAGTIPLLLEGRDVVGQAQTGTGKTAAFAIPMLQRIDLAQQHPQVLVLTPTRELAMQVAEAFERYTSGMRGLRTIAVYGGSDYGAQFRQLDRGVHVVVGTPGRVMDHIRRGSLKLDALRGLVLDEADEMLRMGFADDVDWVLTQSPAGRQIALFSATMPAPIRKIAQRHLNNPAEVTIRQRVATAETVRQRFIVAAPHQKQATLARVLEAEPIDGVLVFVKNKSTTEPLAEFLAEQGHRTAALSSDIPQKQRGKIMEDLRSGKIDIIIATDVAARGLDVQRISHVINYDLPFDSESYVHRIGRTGRAGRSGEAILLLHPRERHLLRRIEQATRQKVEPMDIPSKRAINQRRVAKFHERITAALASEQLATFTSLVEQYRSEHETPMEQIAAALAVIAVGDRPLLVTDDFKPASFAEPRGDRAEFRSRGPQRSFEGASRGPRSNKPMETFRIEVGSVQGVKPANIVGAIAGELGIDASHIGRIEIFDDFSTVDMLAGMPQDMFFALKRVWVAGRPMAISRLHEGQERASAPKKFKPKPKRAVAKA